MAYIAYPRHGATVSSAGKPLSGRLWSLWEILEFDAHEFIGLMNTLRSITHMQASASESRSLDSPLGREALVKSLLGHAEQLSKMRLPISRGAILALKSTIMNHGPLNELADEKVGFACRVLRMETEGRKFLQIDDEDLFQKGGELFGPDVASKFSTVGVFEIDEAGKCLAVGRSTACVFHLMRVMEVGVRAASACLGIADPAKGADRNWGFMLRKFKEDMDRRNKSRPPLWALPSDSQFFDEVYVSLDAVRNVWRNPTMHVESKYTVEEAEHIFASVRGFLKKAGNSVR
jgi:hypothetical protein